MPTEEELGEKYWQEEEYVCDHCSLRTQSTVIMMVSATFVQNCVISVEVAHFHVAAYQNLDIDPKTSEYVNNCSAT